MKKLIAMLLALVLVMGLVACGNTNTNETTPATTEAPIETQESTEAPIETMEATEEAAPAAEPNAATQTLTAIWDAVEEKFFAMGGDTSVDANGNFVNMVDGAPGNYSLTDEGLTASLFVPAEQVANLAEASSLMHAMLANNFTAGMYLMAEDADANAFAEAMKAAIENAQWICGMPEKLVIAIIDSQYVLVAFGINDAIAPFETALTTVYAEAEIVCSQAITG